MTKGGKIYILCSRKSLIKQLIVKSVHRYPVTIKGIEASLYTIFMHDTNAVILNEHWMNKMKKKLENKVNEQRIRLEKTREDNTGQLVNTKTSYPDEVAENELKDGNAIKEDETTDDDWLEPIESGYEL